jgi:hypothetical protein
MEIVLMKFHRNMSNSSTGIEQKMKEAVTRVTGKRIFIDHWIYIKHP